MVDLLVVDRLASGVPRSLRNVLSSGGAHLRAALAFALALPLSTNNASIAIPDLVSYKCVGAVHSAPLDDETHRRYAQRLRETLPIVARDRVCVTVPVDGVTVVSRV